MRSESDDLLRTETTASCLARCHAVLYNDNLQSAQKTVYTFTEVLTSARETEEDE